MNKRKPAEDRKVDIVEALLRLADRIGPDRLTTNDVAREVGVTQAAIFRHFPTKADLWLAVGVAISERLNLAWDAAIAAQPAPKDRLKALISAQLRQIEACPALPAILHSRELNMDNAQLRARFSATLAQFQTHLVAALEGMIAEGTMRRDLAPKDAVVLLTSLVQGNAIRWGLGARGFKLEAEGMRLLDIQLAMFANPEKNHDRT